MSQQKQGQQQPDAKRRKQFWDYTPELPIQTAPYFEWPMQPFASLIYLLKSWNPAGWRFLMLGFAWLVWTFATPSLERIASGSDYRWILEIAVRNLAILWVFAGLLHLWLITWARQGQEARYHVRDMAKNSTKFHFGDQLLDNILWSHVAWVFWCFWECLILWCYAKGIAPMVTFESNPIWFVAMIVAVPIWAGVHFYGLHRLLHIGWFYRHIHSWHHKNIHTGPWSGLAMHPGESFFLFFDTVIFFLIPAHPVHAIFLFMHHGIGAPVSHAGFEHMRFGKEKLPLGDFFHQLHHRFIDCNYGTWDTPWDRWFGTFHDGTPEDDDRILKQRHASMKARKEATGSSY